MGDVVPLQQPRAPEPKVWRCCACSGQLFWLVAGGTIECRECEAVQTLRHFNPEEKP